MTIGQLLPTPRKKFSFAQVGLETHLSLPLTPPIPTADLSPCSLTRIFKDPGTVELHIGSVLLLELLVCESFHPALWFSTNNAFPFFSQLVHLLPFLSWIWVTTLPLLFLSLFYIVMCERENSPENTAFTSGLQQFNHCLSFSKVWGRENCLRVKVKEGKRERYQE